MPELWGTAEVCAMLGVTRAGLKLWRDRHGFPPPLTVLKSGPVWDAETVREWHTARLAARSAAS